MSVDDILNNAKENDISHLLCVAIDLNGSPDIINLAKEHDMVSASVGIHPNTELATEATVDDIIALANADEVVGIGETGLDYFRSEGDLEWQRDRFRTHISVAKELNKPLIIHTREAKEDVIKILKQEGADTVGGVMHCFVEDWETAQAAMDLNFLISFSGIVTFKNAKELHEVAKQVPLEQMLVETDSPYLAPMPFRGKTNQPAYVRHVAEFIATLREIEFDTLAKQTSDNYHRLFN
ncbi:MAG TPA: TatD family deoxyribonuclease [Thiotrichaceae bacterium]|jgi:TatD DNase family protein|nr:TatD family deoxyribonuclease [Thiotrichaceae bacterium]HIM08572.1 TatD family deoxyribonuclease [Gammaproteobacteria bacterium]